MAFIPQAIKLILEGDIHCYVDTEYSLFYKSYDRKSAIDVALQYDLISSVGMIINYIAKYQNNSCFSFLFVDNLVTILDKGIPCSTLFYSEILRMPINFFEWPTLHPDVDKEYAYYNSSIFRVRFEY